MKRLLFFAYLACFAVALRAQTPVLFSTVDFTGAPSTNEIIIALDSRWNPQVGPTDLIGGQPKVLHPDTNGLILTNLYSADYLCIIRGIPKAWKLSVPDTNVTQLAVNLTSQLPTYGYTNFVSSDLRYVSWGGTNTVRYTNNGRVYLAATGTGTGGGVTIAQVTNGSLPVISAGTYTGDGSHLTGLSGGGDVTTAQLNSSSNAIWKAKVSSAGGTETNVNNYASDGLGWFGWNGNDFTLNSWAGNAFYLTGSQVVFSQAPAIGGNVAATTLDAQNYANTAANTSSNAANAYSTAYTDAHVAGATATNALSAVFIDGASLVGTSATNIDFWAGAGMSITGTNGPIGKASLTFGVNFGTATNAANAYALALGGYSSNYSSTLSQNSSNASIAYAKAATNYLYAVLTNAAEIQAETYADATKVAIASGTASNLTAYGLLPLGSGGAQTVQIGSAALANAGYSVAIGRSAAVTGSAGQAIGWNALTTGTNATAIGVASRALSENDVAIGQGAYAKGTNAIAIGGNAIAIGTNTIAFGRSSSALFTGSIAIGDSASNTAPNQIMLGNSQDVVIAGTVTAAKFQTNSAASYFPLLSTKKVAMIGSDNSLTNSSVDATNVAQATDLVAAKVASSNYTYNVSNTLYTTGGGSTNSSYLNAQVGTMILTNPLGAAYGGTGSTNLTSGYFVVGNGTNAVTGMDTNAPFTYAASAASASSNAAKAYCVNGANMTLGTINSNKLDAATQAALGGTGLQPSNNSLTLASGQTILTNNYSASVTLAGGFLAKDSAVNAISVSSGEINIGEQMKLGANQISGNGNGLTNLNAANLVGGPITNLVTTAQPTNVNLTHWAGIDTNIVAYPSAITAGTNAAKAYADAEDTIATNAANSVTIAASNTLNGNITTATNNLFAAASNSFAKASANLTNWGGINTNVVAYPNQITDGTNAVLSKCTNAANLTGTASVNTSGNAGISALASNIVTAAALNTASAINLTNLSATYNLVSQMVATNSTANSNLTLKLDNTEPELDIYATNNLSFTNFTAGASNVVNYKTVVIYPQLVNRTIVWPTLGAPSFGVRIWTNQNSWFPTTFTNGHAYRIYMEIRQGTNLGNINIVDSL